MLAGVFRTNQNHVLLILFLLAPALWTIGIYGGTSYPATQAMPLYLLLSNWLSVISWLPAVVGLLLLLVAAIMSNALYNDLELIEGRDHLCALLLTVLVAFADYSQSLSPALCAMPFLIIAIRKVTRVAESKNRLRTLFDSGLVIGVASFFYLPAALFILPSLVLLPLLGRSSWREFLTLPFGAFFPFLFTLLLSSALNKEIPMTLWDPTNVAINGDGLWAAGGLLLLFLISVPAAMAYYNKSIMRIKNYKAGMAGYLFLFALIGLAEIMAERPCGFTMLAFPVAYYVSHLFRKLRSLILVETLFTIILAVAFWMQWSFINP